MNKEQQQRIMDKFRLKQKKEVKLSCKNFREIIDIPATKSLQEYKKIRVMLQDFNWHNFNLVKGDFVAICEIKSDKTNKIFLDADIGNIILPFAPVHRHSSLYFNFSDFQKIWNNSVEM